MCNFLIKVRENNIVNFIHVSIIKFLTYERKSRNDILYSFYINLSALEIFMIKLNL